LSSSSSNPFRAASPAVRRRWPVERVDLQLPIVRLAAPGVLILRTIVHEQQHARRPKAFDETLEHRLGLAVNPVEVFEDHDKRLDVAFAEEQPLHGVEGALPPLWRIQPRPSLVVDGHIEECQERREGGLQGTVEREHLARDRLTNLLHVVGGLDLEIPVEQLDDRQVRRHPAV
jgi:hypothetical protein